MKYTLRSLRRAPVFALTAIATLGFGANTAVFSVLPARRAARVDPLIALRTE